MRAFLMAVVVLTAGVLAAVVLLLRALPPPPIAPDVEPICRDAMRRTPADLTWVARNREQRTRGQRIWDATLGALPTHDGHLVRVAGVLHLEFEGEALYPSHKAMEEDPFDGTWVTFGSLWPGEYAWRTRGPAISDRCAVVEGLYSARDRGHLGGFKGSIHVLRLEVWSAPHRPYGATPSPPPPPAR